MDAPGLSGVPLAALRAQPNAPRPQAEPNAEIRRIAEEFEAVFLAEMLAPMFENLDTEGLGGGGSGEKMFRPMLVEQYAEGIARAGGVGLADHVAREMMRLQTQSAEVLDGADR